MVGGVIDWAKPLVCVAMLIPLSARGDDAAVVSLREVISAIVDVKAQASKERRDWEGRKEEMAELLNVHRRELVLLPRSRNDHVKFVLCSSLPDLGSNCSWFPLSTAGTRL